MTLTLPPAIEQKLHHTLAQWRHWSCDPALSSAPVPVRVLGSGISNFSILVDGGAKCVVRIDGVNPASHGLSRQMEWRVLAEAHRANLAPCPRYFNPDLGSLVCDFLPPDTEQQSGPDAIAALLRRIHTLPPRHHRLDLAERIGRYENTVRAGADLSAGEIFSCREQVDKLLQSAQSMDSEKVLCHNDLLAANRLRSGGQLFAIDWEYCAMGSRWYDLAVITEGDELDQAQRDALVTAYLGRPADSTERLLLEHYGCIYRYIELLWHLAVQPGEGTEGFVAGRARQLRAILEEL